jgi:chromate transporter
VTTSPLGALAVHVGLLSLIAVGGVTTIVPDLHRLVVERQAWMSDSQFADLFAIARAAPGPNFLFVTLLGWQVAGFPGALVATVAMCGPSCLLTFGVAHAWERFGHAPWRSAVQAGLAPLTVGLVLASGFVLARAAGESWTAAAITVLTVALVLGTRLHPIWMLAAAAALGVAGLV